MKSTLLTVALLLLPAAASAQGPVAPVAVEPMPWVAADLRLAFPAIGDDPATMAGLGITSASDMPTRALTGVAGIHAYPLRRSRWKLGVGAELLMGRGHFQKKHAEGKPVGDPINRTLQAVSWQLSINFGRGQGWSYLTAGSGPLTFDSFRGEGPGDGPSVATLNAGGGARWFKWRRVAVNADIRVYLTKDGPGTTLTAPRGSRRILVLSAGVSLK
ncbi:MAG: hypothetical protein FJW21_02225 [Acidimicrobiia bacterium]|nr:hypothetical protein [Acidimicrobiia bacterium]